MGWVRSHHRRGHRRNGRWVRGGHVRGHTRRNAGRSLVSNLEKRVATRRKKKDRDLAHRQRVSKTAHDICGTKWRSTIAAQAALSIDPELWSLWAQPCKRRTCRSLARNARSLLRLSKLLHTVVGDSAAEIWASLHRKKFEVKLARQIAKRFPLPTDHPLAQAARCLRALLCCLTSGRDMTECDCLQDLARDYTMEQLKRELREMMSPTSWSSAIPA